MTGELRTVGLVVDVTVTVIDPDTSASVTISASSDPTYEVSVQALLNGVLSRVTGALVDRVTGSVCAQADAMIGGE